jgi:hypothetical protein
MGRARPLAGLSTDQRRANLQRELRPARLDLEEVHHLLDHFGQQ